MKKPIVWTNCKRCGDQINAAKPCSRCARADALKAVGIAPIRFKQEN